ncbi:hypothetical protein C7M84_007468 [Penaeus vannamei]|uniref:Uncharacterized protein n=1 Tax=Penaeus vannamei TaxID=6689 RepID=A0A423TC64_PENVA|nr:hypothetical protein C7M84_007468 [Penaeus vannamei]
MAGVTLRSKRVINSAQSLPVEGLSDDWKKRLTDYQFLCGKEEEPLKRRRSLFCRESKKNHRRQSLRHARNKDGYQCPTCKMIVHKSCLNKLTQNHTCTIEYPGNQFLVSQAVPHNAPQPPIPDNLQVQEYPWWAERMSRNEATIHLGLAAEGTFLLRWSDHNEQPVLSLKAMGEVKHMRVYRQEETGYFYLSEASYFTSVVDLVHHYRSSPLSESFTGLDCCLRRPIYDTAIVRYAYEGPGAGHLRLVQGQRVIIISREGEGRGWWKGRIGARMGYFPREYVTLETDPLAGW